MGRTIGVFDSGMGGLTVLRALRAELPSTDFVYLGDTARLPYGTKSPLTVARYAKQAADRLVERGVDALVIACNTASGIALAELQAHFAPLPVYGVVDPGSRAACEVMDASGVLVLATESTVRWGAYQRAIAELRPDVPVHARACPLWVTLAEQGLVEGSVADAVLGHYLRGFEINGPTTLLLGCTHFPVFAPGLSARLPDYTIVDSAATTAIAVARDLGSEDSQEGTGRVLFLATDGAVRFKRVGGFFLGAPIDYVELVDL